MVIGIAHIIIHAFSFQVCLKAHALLKNGTFGKCPEHLANYEAKCRELYPLATAFKTINEETLPTTTLHNHLDCQKQEEESTEDKPTSQTENSPSKTSQEQFEHTQAVSDNIANNSTY